MKTLLCLTISISLTLYGSAQTILNNIQVNAGTDFDHEETTIAINPTNENNLVAGSHYWTSSFDKNIAYYYSTNAGETNGGLTWSEGFLPLGGQYDNPADPVVAFDADGNVYYAHISFDDDLAFPSTWNDNGLFVNRSTNGGMTWLTNPMVVAQNGDGTNPPEQQSQREDKPWIACDALSTSPYRNNVYVIWVRFFSGDDRQIMFSRKVELPLESVFSAPIALNAVGTTAHGPAVAVGPNGIVYVAWFENNAIKVSQSTNGGVSFQSLPDAATGIVPLDYVSNRRANSFPALAVDNSGWSWNGYVHIAWADKRNGNPDIFYVQGQPLPEGGISWGTPGVLHESSTADQCFPAITVDPNGTVHVVYYDERMPCIRHTPIHLILQRNLRLISLSQVSSQWSFMMRSDN